MAARGTRDEEELMIRSGVSRPSGPERRSDRSAGGTVAATRAGPPRRLPDRGPREPQPARAGRSRARRFPRQGSSPETGRFILADEPKLLRACWGPPGIGNHGKTRPGVMDETPWDRKVIANGVA